MCWTNRIVLLVTAALAVSLVACDGKDKQEPPSAPRPPARTLPIPSRDVAPPAPAGVVPAPPDGAGVGKLALHWKLPPTWVDEPPASSMRRAQYRVPGAAGDGECVVYYFGPGQGGDPQSNAARWADQFTQPDGRPSDQAMKTARIEVPGIDVMEVEVTGTYSGGMTMTAAPAQEQPGSMLLGAIAQGPDANWYFKLTGPEATIRAQRSAFEGMLRSLEVGK